MGLDLTILVVMVRSGISMKVWVKVGSRIRVGLVEVRVGVRIRVMVKVKVGVRIRAAVVVRVWTRIMVGVCLEFWLGLGLRIV